jgi:hypothetical protein
MQKDKATGQAIPWNWGHRFKDGSLRVDIPLQDLHSLYNVNYPIVSQVNPHVHLFFFAPKGMPGRPVAHRKGKGWRGGFILSASEHVLKLHLSMNFKIIRDLDLLPSILGQDWSTVFLQQFGGAVTIWPKTRAWDWFRILSDPDRKELSRMINVGKGVTFPKLHMIENRVRLERLIETGRKSARQAIRALKNGGGGGEGVNTMDDLTTAPPSAYTAGLITNQSDTDGINDDFFSVKTGTTPSSSLAAANKDSNLKLRAQLRRLQGLRGLSSVNTPAGTEGEEEEEILDGYGTNSDGGFTGTQTPVTPGQLPRHIRSRSMGLEDERHQIALEDGVESSGGDDVHRLLANRIGGTVTSSTSSKRNHNHRRPASMRWLNDRNRPEESSSSSSEEQES